MWRFSVCRGETATPTFLACSILTTSRDFSKSGSFIWMRLRFSSKCNSIVLYLLRRCAGRSVARVRTTAVPLCASAVPVQRVQGADDVLRRRAVLPDKGTNVFKELAAWDTSGVLLPARDVQASPGAGACWLGSWGSSPTRRLALRRHVATLLKALQQGDTLGVPGNRKCDGEVFAGGTCRPARLLLASSRTTTICTPALKQRLSCDSSELKRGRRRSLDKLSAAQAVQP